jgi:hypothetical protein
MVLIHHVPQKLNALLPLSVTSETTNSNSLLPNTVSKPQLLNPYLYTFSYSEITVDDDVSHEASENLNKESFSPVGPVYTRELTYVKDKNKMYCSKCISIGANNTITAGCDNFKTSSLAIGKLG